MRRNLGVITQSNMFVILANHTLFYDQLFLVGSSAEVVLILKVSEDFQSLRQVFSLLPSVATATEGFPGQN